jgi:hypothetical protein
VSFAVLGLCDCQTSIFGKVKIQGTILQFFTRVPKSIAVDLVADDAFTSKNSGFADVTIKKAHTNSDGSFSISSQAAISKRYHLKVWEPDDANAMQFQLIGVSPEKHGRTTGLGDISVGRTNFVCRIKLVPAIGSTIVFTPIKSSGVIGRSTWSVAPGKDTTVIKSWDYNQADFDLFGGNLRIAFNLITNSTTTSSIIDIPIVSTDTVRTTINY